MYTIGPITFYPQGLLLLLAVAASSYLFWRESIKKKYPSSDLFDFVLAVLLGGIFGARLLYFPVVYDLTLTNFFRVFMIWLPFGMLLWGAFLGALFFGAFFASRYRWNLLKVFDAMAFALPLGLGLGFLAVSIPQAAAFFGLFALLAYFRRLDIPAGFLGLLFLVVSSFIRFAGGFLAEDKTYLWGVNLNQALAIVFFVLGVVGLRGIAKGTKMKLEFPRVKREDLEKLRARLMRQEKELEVKKEDLKKRDPLFEPSRTRTNAEFIEEADEEVAHRNFALLQKAVKDQLVRVQSTLVRLRRGRYGVCEKCKKPIDPARLKVDPTATLCLDCQRRKEQISP